MKLLPEGVTATIPELIDSLDCHLRRIDDIEWADLTKEQNEKVRRSLRFQVVRAYLEAFSFNTKVLDGIIENNKRKNQIADDIAAE